MIKLVRSAQHDPKKCPRCRRQILVKATGDLAHMDICPRCGGLWCRKEDWIDSIHGTHESVQQLAGHSPSADITDAVVTDDTEKDFSVIESKHLACPGCRVKMLELSVGNPPFTVIEQCGKCGGIWLDHLEDNDLIALKAWGEHHEELKAELTWGNWWFQFLSQFPIEYNIRPHRIAWVTYFLIAVCIVVFVIQSVVGTTEWLVYAHTPNLFRQGYQWYTPLTHMFMHGGVLHLIGNMYFLWLVGDNLEDALGHTAYTCFFLVCGLAAIFGYHFLNLHSGMPLLGASGAISGLIAAYAVLFRHAKLTFMFVFWQRRLSTFAWFSLWLAFNVVLMTANMLMEEPIIGEIFGEIAWAAHVSGFLVGLITVLPLRNWIVANTPALRVMDWGESQK